jgi:SAM-dependent methyltransferase
MDGDLSSVLRALREVATGLAALRYKPPGQVVELGPGRTPEFATAFALAGSDAVIALDTRLQVDEHAKAPSRFAGLAQALDSGDARKFTAAIGLAQGGATARLEALSAMDWPVDFLEYDGQHLPMKSDSVDLIVSKSVLEHVPGQAVPGLLSEMNRVLRPGGLIVHSVDLRDHMQISGDLETYEDWLDALRYNDRLFDAMFSRRSTFINRWRTPEWRQAIASAGFRTHIWETQKLPLADDFDRSDLCEPWDRYDLDTLAEARLVFAAEKPDLAQR